MITSDNKYTKMQLDSYNADASNWSLSNKNPVVGSYDEHNIWKDYDILFENISNLNSKTVLDFACGPARNIIKYNNIFKRMDGVDISPINIEKARLNLDYNGIKNSLLYVNNGVDLSIIESESYDIVMSTIALQHICVYDIRKNIFKEIYRILKKDGYFTAQMGFGSPSPDTVGYYDNHYDANGTNRACDVCIENSDQLKNDLLDLSFSNFDFKITSVGPGDRHPNWIFFKAKK